MKSTLKVRPVRSINGTIEVPGDKSMSHRAVMLAGLADGTSRITGFLPSEDCLCTLRAFQALGANIRRTTPTTLEIEGNGGNCRQVLEPIDCGNSGTAMRLMAGILVAQPFTSKLVGDTSLSSRPMKRIIEPLSLMGGTVISEYGNDRAPLIIHGDRIHPIEYEIPVASAQVKSAIMLAAMFAEGATTITEPHKSRDHSERMFRHYHVPIRVDGNTVIVHGRCLPHPEDFFVPGDISSAAFWMGAAAVREGSHLVIENVGLNPTRTGIISVLLRMGAHIKECIKGGKDGEPFGSIEITGAKLHGTKISGPEIPTLIDEIPLISVVGALAQGETVISDAKELRVKETDRIAVMAKCLRAFGVEVQERDDGMVIQGGADIRGTTVDSHGDHRVAMSCAILGLFASGRATITNCECIATSYPGFERMLDAVIEGKLHQTENRTPNRLAMIPNAEK
jgi:3-phosphoshikimate 1-carboxyvinyltransferase